MPKVSAEHLAARRAQIVDAAMRLFAEQGFAATAMSEIIAASGMSAGAVYHYFPAKRDLIVAVGERLRAAFAAPIPQLLATDPPPTPTQALAAIAGQLSQLHAADVDLTRLGIFVWGEALGDLELFASVREVQVALRAACLELVHRWQQAGMVDPEADPVAVAAAFYALFPGYTVQLNILGGIDPNSLASGLAAFGVQ